MERNDYKALKALVPAAKMILEAAEAAGRVMELQASITSMESQKQSLTADVALLAAKIAEHTHNGADLMADLEAQRRGLEAEIITRRSTINNLDETRATAEAQAKADHESLARSRREELQRDVNAARREVADLTKQRDALKQEIADTLSRYATR